MVWVSYDKTRALAWINAGGSLSRTTVGSHNSAMVMAASFLDVFCAPEVIAPRGSQRLQYPTRTYPGPLADFKGKQVPVVGSMDPPSAWLSSERPTGSDNDRAIWWQALQEALRIASWTRYAPGGTAPSSGVFGDDYQSGVVQVQGIAASLCMPTEDPDAAVTEPEDAQRLAILLAGALPVVDALTRASQAGQSLSGLAMSATTDVAVSSELADYETMWRNGRSRRLKIAGGIGGTLLALLGLGKLVLKRAPASGPLLSGR